MRLGISWEALKESDYPALLLGVTTNVFDKTYLGDKSTSSNFKDYSVSATTFFTIDPLLFLLQMAYSYSLEKEIDNKTYKVGNSLILSPQVYFSINPYSSLNMGVQYNRNRKSYYNDIDIRNVNAQLAFIFGYSFAPNEHSTILIDSQFSNKANYTQSVLNVKYIYKF